MNVRSTLINQDTGIILAADVFTLEELRLLVETGAGLSEVVAVKVGFTLGLKYGLPAVVEAVSKAAKIPVIYDHQKAGTDIPQMGKPFAAVCRDAGVKGVIFFPQAGPRTLEGFVKAAFDSGLTPIVGLVMSHDAYLESEGGYIVDGAPERIGAAAIELGVTDFVLPGTKPEIVKRFAAGTLSRIRAASIMMPGIGSQGGSLKTAFRAAKPHRRFAIIGSAIYGAKQPRAALQGFVQEMKHE
jgi:orotidine-5'-phosphate decarboxylase